jgi:hypothetical protein
MRTERPLELLALRGAAQLRNFFEELFYLARRLQGGDQSSLTLPHVRPRVRHLARSEERIPRPQLVALLADLDDVLALDDVEPLVLPAVQVPNRTALVQRGDLGYAEATARVGGRNLDVDRRPREPDVVPAARPSSSGGEIAAIVYSTPENNKFFSIPVSIIRRRAQLPPPLPGQPGPFSLGGAGILEEAYRQAGIREVRTQLVPSPLRLSSAAECVRFERESFGALHQMLSGLPESERGAVWEEIEEKLRQFEGADGFEGPCEMVVGAGVK